MNLRWKLHYLCWLGLECNWHCQLVHVILVFWTLLFFWCTAFDNSTSGHHRVGMGWLYSFQGPYNKRNAKHLPIFPSTWKRIQNPWSQCWCPPHHTIALSHSQEVSFTIIIHLSIYYQILKVVSLPLRYAKIIISHSILLVKFQLLTRTNMLKRDFKISRFEFKSLSKKDGHGYWLTVNTYQYVKMWFQDLKGWVQIVVSKGQA